MPARIDFSSEALAKGKYLYEDTLMTLHEICRVMKISRSTLYRLVDENNWVRLRYASTFGEFLIRYRRQAMKQRRRSRLWHTSIPPRSPSGSMRP